MGGLGGGGAVEGAREAAEEGEEAGGEEGHAGLEGWWRSCRSSRYARER